MCFALLLSGALAQAVEIREGSFDGRAQLMIKTEAATWCYDSAGGGFSRLIDRDGRDWIGFSKRPLDEFPASAAAGYRGLPNVVFIGPDKGAGHPGFDQCASEVVGPNQIRTRSISGRWQWSWTFSASTATFVMEKADADQPWWFLYEGPVAGRFAPAQQYWGTSEGGPNRDVPDNRSQHFALWRWAYFGDVSVARVLYVAQHEPDELADTLWYLGHDNRGAVTASDGMVVFGFGRGPGTQPLLRGAGQRFTVGLLEQGVASTADHAAVAARIERTLAGQPEEASAERAISIWHGPVQHFGQLGQPQRWINVLGNIAAASEVTAATYALNDGRPRPLTLGTDLHRLAAHGDFNVELSWAELAPGTNSVAVIAKYKDGTSVSTDVSLLVEHDRVWPLPYRVDFTKITNLQNVVQVVDGDWTLTTDGVRTGRPWYDRVLSLGDINWTDYEAHVRLTLHGFKQPQRGPPTYHVSHFGVSLRWRGHTADGKQPSERWYPIGAQGELLLANDPAQSRWRVLFGGPGVPQSQAPAHTAVPLNEPLLVRAQVGTLPDGRSRYRFKHWPASRPEPADWHIEAVKAAGLEHPSGSLCLVAHNSDVTIHEVSVTPLAALE